MKNSFLKQTILITAVSSSTLLADTYIGLNYSQLRYSDNGTTENFKPKAIILKGGYSFHKNFAIEASVGMGITNDQKDVTGYENAKVNLDYLASAHLKTILPMSKKLDVNLLLGVSYIGLSTKSDNFSNDGADDSISYGMGFDYEITENISVEANAMHYFDNIRAVELGLIYKF